MNPSEVPAPLRLKVENHVRVCLTESYPRVAKPVVAAEASAIESTAYAKAKSRGEYLCIVTSYTTMHRGRGKTTSDTHRIPALTSAEEAVRQQKFRALLAGDAERVQRNTQGAVQATSNRNVRRNVQHRRPSTKPVRRVNASRNVQAKSQQTGQPVSVSQPIMNNVRKTTVNAQATNQANNAGPAQNNGNNIINGAIVQPFIDLRSLPQNGAPQGFRYVFPFLPPGQAQGAQQPNLPASAQPMLIPVGFVDPRLLAQASAGQGFVPQAVAVTMPQTSQSSPIASSAQSAAQPSALPVPQPFVQQVAQPATGNVGNPALPYDPSGSQFTDEMITAMAHQVALAEARPPAPANTTAVLARSVPIPRNRLQRHRPIAPNGALPRQNHDGPHPMSKEKSDLVAKWIHLQREYRPRVDKLTKALDVIIEGGDNSHASVRFQLKTIRPVLDYNVTKLREDNLSEHRYHKLSNFLEKVFESYKNIEEMDWAQVREYVGNHATVQVGSTGQVSPSSIPQATRNATASPAIEGHPAMTWNRPNSTVSRPTLPQVSHLRVPGKASKMTIQDAQRQLSLKAHMDMQHRQMQQRAAQASLAAPAIQQRMVTHSAMGTGNTTTPISTQQGANVRRTNSLPATKTPTSALAMRAARPASLAVPDSYTANNSLRAANNGNALKRKASQLDSPLNRLHAQKKPTTTQSNPSVRTAPPVQQVLRKASKPRAERKTPVRKQRSVRVQNKKTPSPKSIAAQRVQAVVEEHVHTQVTGHVQRHMEHVAVAVPFYPTERTPKKAANPPQAKLKKVCKEAQPVEQPNPAEQPKPEQPKPVNQPKPMDHPDRIEQQKPAPQQGALEQLETKVQQEVEQATGSSQPAPNQDFIWKDFLIDDIVELPKLLESNESSARENPGQVRESEEQTGDDKVAEGQEELLQELDDIENHNFSPGPPMTREESKLYLIRILTEGTILSQVLKKSTVLGDEAAINRIEAGLNGEKLENVPLRVELTLSDLGVKSDDIEKPKPKPKPKPKVKETKLTLIEQVKEDCEAFQKGCNFIRCQVHEEYRKPVLLCQALIKEIVVPKLVLRVFKGYPNVGTMTYAFEMPPMGWLGPLSEMRSRFRASVSAFTHTCSVGDVLKAWSLAISEVMQGKSD